MTTKKKDRVGKVTISEPRTPPRLDVISNDGSNGPITIEEGDLRLLRGVNAEIGALLSQLGERRRSFLLDEAKLNRTIDGKQTEVNGIMNGLVKKKRLRGTWEIDLQRGVLVPEEGASIAPETKEDRQKTGG